MFGSFRVYQQLNFHQKVKIIDLGCFFKCVPYRRIAMDHVISSPLNLKIHSWCLYLVLTKGSQPLCINEFRFSANDEATIVAVVTCKRQNDSLSEGHTESVRINVARKYSEIMFPVVYYRCALI